MLAGVLAQLEAFGQTGDALLLLPGSQRLIDATHSATFAGRYGRPPFQRKRKLKRFESSAPGSAPSSSGSSAGACSATTLGEVSPGNGSAGGGVAGAAGADGALAVPNRRRSDRKSVV